MGNIRYILYIARCFENDNHLNKKFIGEINGFIKLGYSVLYMRINSDGIYLLNNNIVVNKLINNKYLLSGINKTLLYCDINKAAVEIARKYNPEFAYIRYATALFGFASMVKQLNCMKVKVIVEIPTYPNTVEYRTDSRLWRRPVYSIMELKHKKYAKYIDLYTVMGNNVSNVYERPAINIDNAIDLENIRIRKPLLTDNSVHILAVASMSRWHGYDRLIRGLNSYIIGGGSRVVEIHLVGPDGDGSLIKWRELTNRLNLSKFVHFHGPMYNDILDKMFDSCHIACSALACYMKGIEEGMSLKVVEYCARGIPFIWTRPASHEDKKYTIPYSFGGFGNNSSEINIDEIIKIVDNNCLNSNIPVIMRQYAAENLTWEVQLKKVVNWLSDLK